MCGSIIQGQNPLFSFLTTLSVDDNSYKNEAAFFGANFFLSEFLRVDPIVVLLFYVHVKHLRSCRDGQLT